MAPHAADLNSDRITIHYTFGGAFATDANEQVTYIGGKRLRVRWLRGAGYQDIYKNLLETYYKAVQPAPSAIALFYQLPHDGQSYMRNPMPFNSDAHVAELLEVCIPSIAHRYATHLLAAYHALCYAWTTYCRELANFSLFYIG